MQPYYVPPPAKRHLGFVSQFFLGLAIGLVVLGCLGAAFLGVGLHTGLLAAPANVNLPSFLQPPPDGYLYHDAVDAAFFTFDKAPQDGPISGTYYYALKDGVTVTQYQSNWTGVQDNNRIAVDVTGGLGSIHVTGNWRGSNLLITYQDRYNGFMTITLHPARFDDYNRALDRIKGVPQ